MSDILPASGDDSRSPVPSFTAYDHLGRDELIAELERTRRRLGEAEELLQRDRARGTEQWEELFREVLEKLPAGICLYDASGKEFFANSARSLTWGRAQQPGEQFRECSGWYRNGRKIRRNDWPTVRALQGEVVPREMLEIRCTGSSAKTVIVSAFPLMRDGAVYGVLEVTQDVTDFRNLETQLLQSQKLESVGLLAGGIAHDFNNLLTGIIGYSELLDEQLPPDDLQVRPKIEQILSAAARATELTRSLLAFSRKQIINPKPVLLNDLVVNLSRFLTRIIGEDIQLATALCREDVTVMADRGQMEQVLLNLATNARDAMPHGGRLEIATSCVAPPADECRLLGIEEGDCAVISFTDSGEGMDERTRTRIFEPFYTTKETGKGTGLGLSIIYGIIKQHRGTVTVESSPGAGSCFRIYLPRVRQRVRRLSTQQRVIPFGGSETILLSEDDQVVRQFLKKILEMAGYTVIVAQDGVEAVEKFRAHADEVSLAVLDVVMPRKNGREAYSEILSQKPDMKVIFTSGYTADIIHRNGILDPGLDFLVKPVSRAELLQKVRETLDR